MRSAAPLPRPLAWMVRRLLPARCHDVVLGDLTEDFDRRVRATGRGRAVGGAIADAAGLIASYSAGRLRYQCRALLDTLVEAAHPRGAWRDLSHAARLFRRRPLFALTVVGVLGAGVATSVTTLGFIEAVLLRPLSTIQPDRLRRIVITDRHDRQRATVSNVEREAIVSHLGEAMVVGAASLQPVVVDAGGVFRQTLCEVVSGSYFTILGIRPVAGRLLHDGDDRPGSAPIAIISDALWAVLFDRSADALGATIKLNGAPHTIVGIAPAAGVSSSLGASVDAWVPLAHGDALLNRDWRTRLDDRWMTLVGRLAPGATVAEVDAALTRATAELAQRYPDPWRERRASTGEPTRLVGSQRATVTMLSALVATSAVLVLAVISANVAGLFFVQGAASRRSAAIRLSLGAGRGAVLRQTIAEAVLLGLLAGGAALLLYAAARSALSTITLLPTLSLRLALPFDATLVLATFGTAVLASLLLGLAPAWWLARVTITTALRNQSGTIDGGATLPRVRRWLVGTEVAIAVLLFVFAGVFTRSLTALQQTDLGVDTDSILAFDFDVEPTQMAAAETPGLAREAVIAVRALPGVAAAAMSSRAPVDSSTPTLSVVAGDRSVLTVDNVTVNAITAGYFETVGVPILRGRALDDRDERGATVVINETLAARIAGGRDPIGRHVRLQPAGQDVEIVGIARDARYRSISEINQPHLYQGTAPRFHLALLVRARGAPAPLMPAVQDRLGRLGPGVQGFFPRTLRQHLQFELLPAKAAARAALIVASLALALSTLGLYGLIAWLVHMRRQEIGVRIALGASAADVRRLVVGQAARVAMPGLAAGLLLTLAAARWVQGAVFGVSSLDPLSIAAAIGALVALVVAASWLPAARAARTDPAVVLRSG